MSEVTEQRQDFVLENCQEFNEAGRSAIRAGFDGRLKDSPGESTSIANGLSQQIIHQMNLIRPNSLVSFDDLNVVLEDAAYPLVQPKAKEALRLAIQDRGKPMHVNSAYRTIAQQFLLFQWFNGRSPVAPVGASNHQDGLALDIEDPRGWEPFLVRHGWFPLPGDPPHFDFDPNRAQGSKELGDTAILAFQQLWNKNNPTAKIAEDGAYGPQTEAALGRSPTLGFDKAPWDDQPRILRLTQPRLEGSDVERLQTALKKAGIAVGVDGVFGPGTDKAVKEFQQKQSLTADGIVGPKTLGRLA